MIQNSCVQIVLIDSDFNVLEQSARQWDVYFFVRVYRKLLLNTGSYDTFVLNIISDSDYFYSKNNVLPTYFHSFTPNCNDNIKYNDNLSTTKLMLEKLTMI